MTHPIAIDAARLTWDGRTPTGHELPDGRIRIFRNPP
jgi:hypothetical protein